MITLTKAEERIMQIMWEIEKGFIKDIQSKFPDPKPPYNSISTIVRILVKKEVVSFKQYGNTYQYFPLVSKEEYSKTQINSLVSKYFNNSFKSVVNFLSESNDINVDEVDEVLKMLEEIKKQKNAKQ